MLSLFNMNQGCYHIKQVASRALVFLGVGVLAHIVLLLMQLKPLLFLLVSVGVFSAQFVHLLMQ